MTSLTLLRLLPNLLHLNGSLGNHEVLQSRLRHWDFALTSVDRDAGTSLPAPRPDLIVIGHGTSSMLPPAAAALESWAKRLRGFVEDGSILLGIGLGGDLLGENVVGRDGQTYPGLGLTDVQATLGGVRASTEVAGVDASGRDIAGYLNDQTIRVNPGHAPWVTLVSPLTPGWRGNTAEGGEGVVNRGVFATALSGPLLALNPHLADDLIDATLATKGLTRPEPTDWHLAVDESAAKARAAVRTRLGLN